MILDTYAPQFDGTIGGFSSFMLVEIAVYLVILFILGAIAIVKLFTQRE
jgi:hypothetical protein